MDLTHLIEDYLAGPQQLRQAVSGMTEAQLNAAPVPGKWSSKQVICHLADFELVYADRMKRVIAEDNPPLRGGDPDTFAAKLSYDQRRISEELQLIETIRNHVATILKTLSPDAFQRVGMHSADGPLTLETLLRRVTTHVPHHVRFIEEKKQALSL